MNVWTLAIGYIAHNGKITKKKEGGGGGGGGVIGQQGCNVRIVNFVLNSLSLKKKSYGHNCRVDIGNMLFVC